MVKQLSIFVQNKSGKLAASLAVLRDNGIDIRALTIADTPDFGILRLIVSEVDKAVEVLREENFAVMLTDVVCIKCKNSAGSLSTILEQLSERDIFIEYMYAFADGEMANVVIRPNDIDKCVATLQDYHCDIQKCF